MEELFEALLSIIWIAAPAPSWTGTRNAVLNGWERVKGAGRRVFRR